jgi:hypothetical protein
MLESSSSSSVELYVNCVSSQKFTYKQTSLIICTIDRASFVSSEKRLWWMQQINAILILRRSQVPITNLRYHSPHLMGNKDTQNIQRSLSIALFFTSLHLMHFGAINFNIIYLWTSEYERLKMSVHRGHENSFK